MRKVTIYHNPRCTKSRETLALLEAAGEKPTVIEYLKTPPTQAELTRVLALLGKSPLDVVRKQEAPFKELGLASLDMTKDADRKKLIKAMAENPILIERPIVVVEKSAKDAAARVGRPPESVKEIL